MIQVCILVGSLLLHPHYFCLFHLKDPNHLDGGLGEEDYQALTEREEKDLERVLAQSETALSNAEKFMEELAKDLSLLDGVNCYMHSLSWLFLSSVGLYVV